MTIELSAGFLAGAFAVYAVLVAAVAVLVVWAYSASTTAAETVRQITEKAKEAARESEHRRLRELLTGERRK